jgi:hypothetical protein
MRTSIKKMRIKKVSRKAPKWKQQRLKDQSLRVTLMNRSFDLSETEDEAVAIHQGRRYP